jgi:DNA-binding PadR family transcriptional regulator
MPRQTIDLIQGTLDLLVLQTLSWGPAHGYAIARWIEQLSENNRRAKFYQLTPLGRRQLRHETKTWGLLVEAVGKVLKTREQPT